MCWGRRDFWEWKMFSSLKNKNRSRKIESREAKTFGVVPTTNIYQFMAVPKKCVAFRAVPKKCPECRGFGFVSDL